MLEGKINDKRHRGRLKHLEGLALAAGCGAGVILRKAGDRADFRYMVANVRL